MSGVRLARVRLDGLAPALARCCSVAPRDLPGSVDGAPPLTRPGRPPMPDWLAVVLLGVIEGITEFLPISSTGHLLLAENTHLLPQQSELFNVVIQAGAVLAVFFAFSSRIKESRCSPCTSPARETTC